MAVAMLFPEPEKGGRGKKNSSEKEGFMRGLSAGKVSEARAILRETPEVAKAVMAGTKTLNWQRTHEKAAPARRIRLM